MTDPARWREALRNKADETRVARMWSHIQTRHDLSRWQSVLVPRRRLALGASAAVVGVLALGIGYVTWSSGAPSPLELEGAPLPRAFEANQTYVFSDASQLVTSDETTIDVLESRSRTVRFALRTGEARFSITPGGPRRWEIASGEVTVEVVGTVFRVRRRPGRVRVAVERGSVLVHGANVVDNVQRLEAGESVTVVDSAVQTDTRSEATTFDGRERRGEPASSDHSDLRISSQAVDQPAEHAAGIISAEAHVASADGRDASRVTDLMHRADALRLAGRPAEAARALEEVVVQHRADSRAALAAYSLARLRLEVLDQASQATRDFDRSLALGLSDPLREAAFAGRVESLGRSGRVWRAREAAARYVDRYPNGRYREQVNAWQ